MKIIFLDIDGVLNNYDTLTDENWNERKWEPNLVEMLKRIIKETGAEIVLSSTWRRIESYCDIIKNDMKINYIGKTPVLWKKRGIEIQTWLDENPGVEKFVILDDDSDMVHLMDHLLQTDGEFGLTEEIADEAIEMLNKRI